MAVFGEKESESSRSVAPGGYVPARENSIRSRFDNVVTVPTVDRDVPAPPRWRSAMAGGRPVMSSTFGAPAGSSRRRAYGATDSTYRRCASA